MTNLYADESHLIQRLGERLPETVQVLPAPYLKELKDLQSFARRMPAVFVMELGGKPFAPEGSRPARAVRALQRWALIVAVRDRTDAITGSPVRLSAGELAWDCIDAVHGWTPAPSGRCFQLSEWLEAIYPGGGLMMLPVLFTHETPRLCG